MNHTWFVAVYVTNKAHGGREEGGWYYDVGYPSTEHLSKLRAFTLAGEPDDGLPLPVAEYRDKLRADLEFENRAEGNYPPSSVLCNGWLDVYITVDELPAPYPQTRPRYS